MAFIKCQLHSKVMALQTTVNIIIPEKLRDSRTEEKYPVLYLLHGLTDDQNAWSKNTSIERYVEDKELIVVMPWGGHSFYTNMKYGPKVYSYITEELPRFCEQMFPVSRSSEDRFIAGLSMGGYGAFRTALSKPGSYAAAASLSGALDITYLMNRKNINIWNEVPDAIYGENTMPSAEKDDLFAMTERLLKKRVKLPELYMICGTEDFLYKDNVRFANHLQKLGVHAKIRWEPGEHDWKFWDRHIQEVLDWLPVKGR